MVGAGTDKTKPPLGGGPAIILVRPQLAVNIGMCARAMANFGLGDLRLVNPREGWPREGARRKSAYAAAASASGLLDNAKVYPSVKEAVADLHYVYATTARERGQLKRIYTPAEAMPEAAGATFGGEKRGVLFGPERTGLDNDDVALADAIISFPVSPGYASLNLAQAVLLCGYEWYKAAHGGGAPIAAPDRSPPATREMVLAFFEMLEGHLEERGFFRPAPKRPVMQRNLRNIFHRIGMTQQDVRTLWGAIVRLVEGPRVVVQTRKRRSAKKAEA
jgi:tRNA/rRNA methyltransferase